MVILNTIEALEEFDKKSSIYSERPRLEMGGELVGYSETLVLMRYGPRFRHYRKQFARYIGNGVIQDRHALLQSLTRTFLQRVLKQPEELMSHLRK
jgi:cytochrome P450